MTGRSRRTTTSSSSRLLRFLGPGRGRRELVRLGTLVGAGPPQAINEIDDDEYVHDEGGELDRRRTAEDLVDLEGNQRARRDHRQIFRPSPLAPQPDPLGTEERGVE